MPTRAAPILRVLLVSATGFAAMQWTAPASACGPAPPTLHGRPLDGNTNVPTDAVPFYNEPLAWLDNRLSSARFVLMSPTGNIPTTATHRPTSTFDLKPERSLSPNTKYTLHGTWTVPVSKEFPTGTVDRSLEFTSGAGPYDKVLAAPKAGVQHYVLKEIDGTFLGAGSCIFFPSDLPIEATFFSAAGDGGAEWGPRLFLGPFFHDLSGVTQNEHDCVRLRLRAPNGDMSAPTVVCRNDGPLLMVTPNDELLCRWNGIRPMADAGIEPPSDVITDGSADRLPEHAPEGSADRSPEYVPGSEASCSLVGAAHARRRSVWGMLATLSIVTACCGRRHRSRRR